MEPFARHPTKADIPRLPLAFRDYVVEETNHPREVVGATLAHVVQNKVEAAYARSDLFEQRRRLMDDWVAYLTTQGVQTTRGRDSGVEPSAHPYNLALAV